MSLAGRCALVTGAARGIGLATAQALCERGMKVAINDLNAVEAEQVEDYLRMIPSGRLAMPDDHSATIAWLASDESAHITGQVISVDGGQSLYHPVAR